MSETRQSAPMVITTDDPSRYAELLRDLELRGEVTNLAGDGGVEGLYTITFDFIKIETDSIVEG